MGILKDWCFSVSLFRSRFVGFGKVLRSGLGGFEGTWGFMYWRADGMVLVIWSSSSEISLIRSNFPGYSSVINQSFLPIVRFTDQEKRCFGSTMKLKPFVLAVFKYNQLFPFYTSLTILTPFTSITTLLFTLFLITTTPNLAHIINVKARRTRRRNQTPKQ